MKADAHYNYKRRLRDPVLAHMKQTLEELNAKSVYNTFTVLEKKNNLVGLGV